MANKILIIFFALTLFSCSNQFNERKKPIIVFTFDDENHTIYDIAFPIMKEYDFKGTLVVNTGIVNNYPHILTWDQIYEMVFENGWETAGHTLHHIDLVTSPKPLIHKEIYLDWLNLKNRGLPHETFALPAGHANDYAFSQIEKYYKNIRISIDLNLKMPIDRKMLGYFFYQTDFDYQDVIERINDAVIAQDDVLILGFHRFENTNNNSVDFCKPDDFRKIVQYVFKNRFQVMTIKDMCNKLISY